MPISGDSYKAIGRAAAGAVSVVTVCDHTNGEIFGLTVSSFVTLSFDPPLVMFAIQHRADSYRAVIESKSFGVSLLSIDQADTANNFAKKGRDKVKSITFDQGHTLEVPLIPDSLAQLECLTNQIFLSGDHAIIVGLVEDARTQDRRPLLYFNRQFGKFSALANA